MNITKELVNEFREKYPEVDSYNGLANKMVGDLGLDWSKQRSIRRNIARHWKKDDPAVDTTGKEKFTIDEKDDAVTYEYVGDKRIANFDDAVKHCGVDLSVWEIDRKIFNSWEVTMAGKGKDPITRTNFQYKLWFKRKQETYTKDDFISDIYSSLSDISTDLHKARKERIERKGRSGNAGEIDIFDPHLGKLAWGKETGENYDIKIAKERYIDTISDLIHKAKGFDLEKIYYPLGNDFFHVDTLLNTTTAGTQLDADVRWQKSWTEGRATAIRSIEMLREVAPVEVIMVPGNHDAQRTFYLGDLLDILYANQGDVSVVNIPSNKKFFKWGKCAVMLTHGDEGKYSEYPLVMMRHIMKMQWTDVEFMEVHTGHFHKTKKIEHLMADEFQGIVVRVIRSIAGTDAWHYNKNFTNNLKGAEAFIWNQREGMIADLKSNIL